MPAPKTDQTAIRQTIRALRQAGVVLTGVDYSDGEGLIGLTKNATETVIIDIIMAVDDCNLLVELPSGSTSFIRFVMGNDPDEVIADYGVGLSPVLDPLTHGWWF